jgi:hypothetical protein
MNYPQIKPTLNLDFSNTKTLDPRINFRRGTPGAYYDGKTYAKAEENLIEHSEDFSQWGAGTGISVISDDNIAPDGSQTASLINDGTNLGYKQYHKTINHSDGVYVASIYVKNPASAGRQFLILSCYWNLTSYAAITFDTINETIQSSEDGNFKVISSFTSDVGNGWYRIGLSFSVNSYPHFTFNVNMSNSADNGGLDTYTGSNQKLYIWGAQLEQRDSLTAYTPTDGTSITKYQPQLMFASPDQPRFDHDVLTGESKGLLIEESRTNLIAYSEDFANMDWIKFAASIVDNITIAPDGTLTGGVLSADLTNDDYVGIETKANYISFIAGEYYTSSYYLKKGSHSYCQLFHQGGVSNDFANFNLDTGEVSSASNASIEHVGNGWYRCSLTSVSSSNITTAGNHLIIVDDMSANRGGTKTFTNTDDNIYIWGAQLEEGSFATSYIKTSGASVTRSADNASITGENFSSWYRQDEGSLYCEALKKGATTNVVLSINDSTDDNRMFINLRNNEHFEITKNSVGQVAIGEASIDYNNFNKICATYKKDDSAVCIDGSNASSDAACEIPYVDRLLIGQNYSSDVLYYYNCHIKKLSYYPQRLTNEQLQQLTK